MSNVTIVTETDETFEMDQPGYYLFDEKLYEEKCLQCGKVFRSHLELNRFCSREHQKSFLREAFKRGA